MRRLGPCGLAVVILSTISRPAAHPALFRQYIHDHTHSTCIFTMLNRSLGQCAALGNTSAVSRQHGICRSRWTRQHLSCNGHPVPAVPSRCIQHSGPSRLSPHQMLLWIHRPVAGTMQWMQLLVGTVSSQHAPGRQARAMSLHTWLGSIL